MQWTRNLKLVVKISTLSLPKEQKSNKNFLAVPKEAGRAQGLWLNQEVAALYGWYPVIPSTAPYDIFYKIFSGKKPLQSHHPLIHRGRRTEPGQAVTSFLCLTNRKQSGRFWIFLSRMGSLQQKQQRAVPPNHIDDARKHLVLPNRFTGRKHKRNAVPRVKKCRRPDYIK